jgi:hypothetical protein
LSTDGMYKLISETISDRLLLLKQTPAKTHRLNEGLQEDDRRAYIGRSCLLAQEMLDINAQFRLYTELELSRVERLEYLGRYLQIVKHEVGKELP